MKPTKVVNVNNEVYDVYIGRGSKWGNQFRIGIDGNRIEVIKKYETMILNNQSLKDDISELDGKILGCHCKPKACHGDILVKLVMMEGLVV